MPPHDGTADVPIEIVGGLVCDSAAMDLPAGVSPDCQDCDFSEDGVRTRPGLGFPLTELSGNFVQYLKTFITSNGTLRAMAFTDTGWLYKETSLLTFTGIQQLNDAIPTSGAKPYCNSSTQFAREYLAFSDGKFGVGWPRQYDDTFLDRVAQGGPGAAPIVGDEPGPLTIDSATGAALQQSALSLNSISFQNGIVTATTISGFGSVLPGGKVVISGVTPATYNGTFTLLAGSTVNLFYYALPGVTSLANGSGGTIAPLFATLEIDASVANPAVAQALQYPPGLSVTVAGVGVAGYNGTWSLVGVSNWGSSQLLLIVNLATTGNAISSGGTVTINGNVAAGVHQVSVIFVTRQGYLTAPAPPKTWTAAGGKRVTLSAIPVGPSNVVQRIIVFTQSGGAQFFYLTGVPQVLLSNFVINDNTTTSATFDFSDGILAAGALCNYLFNQVVLGECAGTVDYSNRQFWWGERAKVQNFVNLDFNGGFTNPGSSPNYPLGWTPDPTFAPGGQNAGDGQYGITGNGATATRGKMTQSAYQDWRQTPILQPNTDYSVRARVARNPLLTQGTLHINLQSTIGAFTTTGLQLAANAVTNAYVEYTADILQPLATIPPDIVLQIYADGTPTSNGEFTIFGIEIYPTNTPNNLALVRASRAFNPESFDGVTGLLQPNPTDGQRVTAMFVMRERLYIVKEHSLWVTQDDGTNEPANWTITPVSKVVGTPSVRGIGLSILGVGTGEDWAVIAHRTGLYIFWGTEPQKISQEIHHATGTTLAWDQINWQYAHTMWVTVDIAEKRVYVGAPFNGAVSPSAVLVMDYRKIDPDEGATGAEAIAANGPIRLRYTGMKAVMDKSRKWTPWTMGVNSCALIERFDGTTHLWMGAGTSSPVADAGAIYDLQRGQLTDYSTQQQIPAYYWTCFTPQREQNQQIQTHEHRKHFTYLTMFIEGAGMVSLTAAPQQFGTFLTQTLPSLFLSSPAIRELETPIDVSGERVAFKIAPLQSGSAPTWFRLQKLTLSVSGDPVSPVRGVN